MSTIEFREGHGGSLYNVWCLGRVLVRPAEQVLKHLTVKTSIMKWWYVWDLAVQDKRVHPLVLAAYSAIFILTPLAGTTMLVDRPPCAATLLPQSAVTPGQGRVHYAHHVRRLRFNSRRGDQGVQRGGRG